MQENFQEISFDQNTVLNEIGMVFFDVSHDGWKWSTGTKTDTFGHQAGLLAICRVSSHRNNASTVGGINYTSLNITGQQGGMRSDPGKLDFGEAAID